MDIPGLYKELLAFHGPQGWFPLPSRSGSPGYDRLGYHPGLFLGELPPDDAFEVASQCILAQNTAWTNAERAYASLRRAGLSSRESLAAADETGIASAIREAGFMTRKARALRATARVFNEAASSLQGIACLDRERLLGLWGIGEETADCIGLYALGRADFVADAYARRLVERLGIAETGLSYGRTRSLFMRAIPNSAELFGEFHALIDVHAKTICLKRPLCQDCPLAYECPRQRVAE